MYVGMSAGVGKTYRMLQEAHALLKNGIDVKIAYIETHSRVETQQLVEGLPLIPRKKVFYKGKELEEMDMDAILNLHPEVVIVDELAHTNVFGSKNDKRWQDVMEILNAGINVISAVNIQHLESLNSEIEEITGIEVQERIPDSILQAADEVVNIDLTADELVQRLNEGKIYDKGKIELALKNFFAPEKILQLRELALKEVASQVVRKIDIEVLIKKDKLRPEKFLTCISTHEESAKKLIRKTSRLASFYNSKFIVLYVQTPRESTDNINLAAQRHLINNFKLATEMGGEVVQVQSSHVAQAIADLAIERKVTSIIIGKPAFSLVKYIFHTSVFSELVNKLAYKDIDIMIVS